ncbi:MAG: hypothetical protein ACOYL3_24400 [Desulfuromonadaceae bacterium]
MHGILLGKASVAAIKNGDPEVARKLLGEALNASISEGEVVLDETIRFAHALGSCDTLSQITNFEVNVSKSDKARLQSLLLNQIGYCWMTKGNDAVRAEKEFTLSLDILKGISVPVGELAIRLNNIGWARTVLGQSTSAIEAYRKAFELRRSIGDPLTSQSAYGLAAAITVSGKALTDGVLKKEAIKALEFVVADDQYRELEKNQYESAACMLISKDYSSSGSLFEKAQKACP